VSSGLTSYASSWCSSYDMKMRAGINLSRIIYGHEMAVVTLLLGW